MGKSISREELVTALESERSKGKKIGYTSGAFDLIHMGHVTYLQEAKSRCDILVVGVNSDSSVQASKGPLRPIVPENERLAIIAALECVDYAFLFSEQKNLINIQLLKPDYYIKGKDYASKPLTSASELEKHGGKVLLIDFVEGNSTTERIRKIRSLPESSKLDVKLNKAAFLDRDGTLIEDADFPKDPSKVRLLPGVVESLKRLQSAGFALIVVTNQAGIGMGYLTEKDFIAVDREMRKQISKEGIMLDKVYYCPHNLKHGCECMKPKPYFANLAAKELGIDLSKSFMIGDKMSDVDFGKNAGMKSILLSTVPNPSADYSAPSFKESVDFILRCSQ